MRLHWLILFAALTTVYGQSKFDKPFSINFTIHTYSKVIFWQHPFSCVDYGVLQSGHKHIHKLVKLFSIIMEHLHSIFLIIHHLLGYQSFIQWKLIFLCYSLDQSFFCNQ
jgi:hypothetical protein